MAYNRMTTQEIKDILSKDEVKFSYEEQDGTIREAFGTRNVVILILHNAIPTGDKAESDDVIPYFDLDAMTWKSFKSEKFMGILD